MPIIVNLDVMMAKRKMSLNELSEKVELTLSNLSILKTGKAKPSVSVRSKLYVRRSIVNREIFWSLWKGLRFRNVIFTFWHLDLI